MLRKKFIEKTIAVFLIFTLTFANFALVTKSYATTIFDSVFSGSSDTGSKNVEFEAYLGAENEKSDSVISAANGKNVNLGMNLAVLETGYLKNTQIEIKEKEKASGINFKVAEEIEETDYIKSFSNNTLKLKQINSNSNVKLSLPLTYVQEEYIELSKLSKDFIVVLTGTYVNDKGEEVAISKVVPLNLTWEDKRQVQISSEITKYIPYSIDEINGVILQTLIKVDTTAEKSGAVKSTNLEIAVPKIEGAQISKVNVVAKSTLGTDGKTAEEVDFSEDNWKLEDDVLKINKENKPKFIKDEIVNEENTLLEENEKAKEVEKYYSTSGADEYLITYTYKNVSTPNQKLSSKVNATVTTFGKEDIENKSEQTFEYELSETIGDIVTFEVQNEETSISKGYTYYNLNSENGLYEMQFDSKEIVNISYKDIVESVYVKDDSSFYIDKEDNKTTLNDIFYKSISVSKINFDEILGEDGEIQIQNQEGNIIAKITKDTEVDEKGNLTYTFEEYKINNVIIKTSNPIKEGNLIFSVSKVQKNSSYNKNDFSTFAYMDLNSKAEAKYTYVENLVDAGNAETKIELEDTATKADLELSTTSISTLEPTNVEMKIKLNNNNIKSDIYGNSVFEIVLPEYIEDLKIIDYNMAYGEGLNLTNVEAYNNEEGKIVIKATIEGIQNELSTGKITNGTNIVLNCIINANKYTPSMEDKIELRVQNEEATNYETDGISTFGITYAAPLMVVPASTIKNYDCNNSEISSLKQGTKYATIATNSETINASMEMVVINNNLPVFSISNISILGRVPFKGNKNIVSGTDLGTTITTPITTGIMSDSNNNTNFNIYYSANEEATRDLNDSSNGWTQEINSSDIKSFLIVPEDPNYKLEGAKSLKFSYGFNIPANLDFENKICGDYVVYYTEHLVDGDKESVESTDLVYLTTGIGPKLELETTVDCGEKATENEEITITSKVNNTGKVELEDVQVSIPVPEGTTYSYAVIPDDTIEAVNQENTIIYTIPKIGIGESKEVGLKVKVNPINSASNLEEDGNNLVKTIKINSSVTAKNLSKPITSEEKEVKVSVAKLMIELENKAGNQEKIRENSTASFSIAVTNSSAEELKNVEVKIHIDPKFKFKDIFLVDSVTNQVETLNGYDENSVEFIYKMPKMKSMQKTYFAVNVQAKELPEGSKLEKGQIYAVVKSDEIDSVNSNSIEYTIGKPIVTIVQKTNTDTYVKTGDTIEYVYTIKNEGTYRTGEFDFIQKVPTGLRFEKMAVGNSVDYIMQRDEIKRIISLDAGEKIEVKLNAVAEPTENDEYSVTSKATVKSSIIGEIKSNEITHIVEDAIGSKRPSSGGSISNGNANQTSSSTGSNIVKTYKISGCVWIDENANGMREQTEKMKSSIKATLVESETGVIKNTVTTSTDGTYEFAGLAPGKYIVVFDYDAAKYTLTAYQKEGVTTNSNSDVISTQIEQDGQLKNRAVTEVITISDVSISNIDMGLVEADVFDLQLRKTVSKITVQNKAGTKSTEYDNVELAKKEIAGKHLASSTVYIEYTMIVENKGDVEGFAKTIVDYIPEGLTFNSSMNPDWYTGNDGNLYTTSLANKPIAKGQSATVKLVLTKQMTEQNTGIVNNTAEIAEDYNVYGIADINSKAGNKVESENDFGSANVIISVNTGEVFIYTSIILTTILLGGIAVFVTYNKLSVKRRKEGGV